MLRRPAYVGNCAYPAQSRLMEILSFLSFRCHTRPREVEPGLFGRYSVVPRESSERRACAVLATVAAAVAVALPALFGLAVIGGIA